MALPTCTLVSNLKSNELKASLDSIRDTCDKISSQAPAIIPYFTDHTIYHMDNLFSLVERVLTDEQLSSLSEAESFLLGASFYLHDIGMTLPVLPIIREKYFPTLDAQDTVAVQECVRTSHHLLARAACSEPISAESHYIISETSLRETFADSLSQICVSHGESIATLDRSFGASGTTSFNQYGTADLGFLACVLRVVDYADLTGKRASSTILLTRPGIPQASRRHWDAQEKIAFPIREGALLRYNSLSPLASMEAWWQLYDLLIGLDKEIKSVRSYLSSRRDSGSRFSLEGVASIDSPRSLATLVKPPPNVIPIDVQIRVPSVNKLVHMFAGRQLYGHDRQASIRELLQNARDAIGLRKAMEGEDSDYSPRITVMVTDDELSVSDNGIGMNQYVVENFLLGIASSYWGSDYAAKEAAGKKIGHAGRFGVGFVSVFTLGSNVFITTKRKGSQPIRVELSGLDNRGVQKRFESEQIGTMISVRLNGEAKGLAIVKNPVDVIRARAPMLSIPVTVQSRSHKVTINPSWWVDASATMLSEFLEEWADRAYSLPPDDQRESRILYARSRQRWRYNSGSDGQLDNWPTGAPEARSSGGFLILDGGKTGVLACSHGLAVSFENVGLLSGMIEVGEQDMQLSRSKLSSSNAVLENLSNADTGKYLFSLLKEDARQKTMQLGATGVMSRYINLVDKCRRLFGDDYVSDLDIPWVPMIGKTGDIVHQREEYLRNVIARQKKMHIVIGVKSAAEALQYLDRVRDFSVGNDSAIVCGFYDLEIAYDRQRELLRNEHDPLKDDLETVAQRTGVEIVDSACEYFLSVVTSMLRPSTVSCNLFIQAKAAVVTVCSTTQVD